MPSYEINLSRPSFTTDQEDGARWYVYEDPDHLSKYTILTNSGHDLFQGTKSGEFMSLIQRYHAAELGRLALIGSDLDIRQKLGSGQEATVYAMGPYAVREQQGIKNVYGALGELERMDAVNQVIEQGLPRWLNLPRHYAVYTDPGQQKTYTIMDRINGGVTAEDVINYPELSPEKLRAVEQEVGEHILEAQAAIPLLFDNAHDILSRAIQGKGKEPTHYLTDWHPRNVVLERLQTPVASQRYSLNVIDQYRS